MAMDPMQVIRDRAHARVGSVIRQKWQLDGLLGLGGTAAVFSATHRNGAVAAVKILRAELCGFPDVVQRFVREGYVANKIGHPSVVSVLDDDVTDEGAPFLVMELLHGESLERYTKGPALLLPMSTSLRVVDSLLDVLVAAHQKGVLHRDIKPANLFLLRDGRVKVLDFGIARLAEGHDGAATQTGTTIGTPGYMPPEQARGRWSQVDARTDVWAAGATAYALLSGYRPRRAETAQEELLLAMTAPVPPIRTLLPQLDPGIAAVVDTAVAFEMDARFPSARAMQDALRAAMAALPANATSGPMAAAAAVDATIPTGPTGAGSRPSAGPSWGNDAVHAMRPPSTGSGVSQPPQSALTDVAQVVEQVERPRSRAPFAIAAAVLALGLVLGIVGFRQVRQRLSHPPSAAAPSPSSELAQPAASTVAPDPVPTPASTQALGASPASTPSASATLHADAALSPSAARSAKPVIPKNPPHPPPSGSAADPFDRRF
jgi:eukaryotic-like serine/threonine-protein kinase